MKFFIIIKEESERLPNKNFLTLGGIPLYRHLLNGLALEDVYIDTDSDKIFNECKTLTNITCYKRDSRFVEMENNIEFGVSPVLFMIENFLNKFVDSMKDTKLNRIKRSAILYKVINASGMSPQQLMADIQKIKQAMK